MEAIERRGLVPMEREDLVCPRDGTPTKLRCAKCGAGICPACLVRTPVGYNCAGCAGGRARPPGGSRAGRALPGNGIRSLSELNINPGVVVPLSFVFDLPATVEPAEAQFRGTGRSRFGVSVRLQRRA